jgi:hypothetical protein
MNELHRRKAAQGSERATVVDYTKVRAQVRAVAIAINQEGMPHTMFPRDSQHVATAVVLLDTLPVPSTDGASKVYQ